MSSQDIHKVLQGMHPDPFCVLGLHDSDNKKLIRTFCPGAKTVEVYKPRGSKKLGTLAPIDSSDIFEGTFAPSAVKTGYRLVAQYDEAEDSFIDPYCFDPTIGDFDLHLISEGRSAYAYRVLGAHIMTQEGVEGTRFAVWAPNAAGVCVAGDFNLWSTVKHPLRSRGASGVWELFIPGAVQGQAYKFAIRTPNGDMQPLKADPFAFGAEYRPKSASVIRDMSTYQWRDDIWMEERVDHQHREAPISIYEVHLGSWRRGEDNRFLSYKEIGRQLIPYAKDMGFTHLELMPITEHPLDASWGYQPIGLYAPTARHGDANDFKAFVDAVHEAGLALILDWVPGHFPSDEHGLGKFDGTNLYEHADLRKGFHPDWNTLIFNFGRREVINYLVANARFWLEEYHLDGLRVDAVASMLYLDYSRKDGEWIPNSDGSNENWEAVDFLKEMNLTAYKSMPGIITIAEESTAWPGVTRPTHHDGLGFGFKWNMGWMNDTLEYMSEDPINRSHHHHKMTFGIDYAFTENYVLPLSHDEVVHGKGSLIDRMPGDRWQKYANLRAYYGFMWAHPGKKLLFMGSEFGQSQEWRSDQSLDWHLTKHREHSDTQTLVTELNRFYQKTPAMYEQDCVHQGFQWVDGGAQQDNVIAFLRWDKAGDYPCLCVSNFSAAVRENYRIGVPKLGLWKESINTDSVYYGGSGKGNLGGVKAEAISAHGFDNSVDLCLPPLATLIFRFTGEDGA